MNERTQDNRNMEDMERWYEARIEAYQARIRQLEAIISEMEMHHLEHHYGRTHEN